MQIGLIGGIGPGATDFYYRSLIEKFASEDADLDMTIVHADASTLVKNLMDDNKDAQVAIYQRLTQRLKNAGAECVAITSIAGHFCIERFVEKSVLPIVDLLSCVRAEVENKGYEKIGILGTKPVMESKFYSVIKSAEIVLPEGDLLEDVHNAYVEMATSGHASEDQKLVFDAACNQFITQNKVDALMLGGTDLALVYNTNNVDFALVDCAAVHVQELFRLHSN